MKTEKLYKIVWEINQYAKSPEEAIAKAILAMPVPSNNDSIATVFDVTDHETNKKLQIDTLELEGEDQEKFVLTLDGLDEDEIKQEIKDRRQNEKDELQKTMDKCRDENRD